MLIDLTATTLLTNYPHEESGGPVEVGRHPEGGQVYAWCNASLTKHSLPANLT